MTRREYYIIISGAALLLLALLFLVIRNSVPSQTDILATDSVFRGQTATTVFAQMPTRSTNRGLTANSMFPLRYQSRNLGGPIGGANYVSTISPVGMGEILWSHGCIDMNCQTVNNAFNNYSGNINQYTYSPDGSLIGAIVRNRNGAGNQYAMVAGSDGKKIGEFNASYNLVADIDFGFDGSTFAVAYNNSSSGKPSTVVLYDVSSGGMLAQFDSPVNWQINSIALSPAGTLLAFSDSASIYVYSLVSNALIATLSQEPARGATELDFSPDGKQLAAAGWSEITIWDPETASMLRSLDASAAIYAMDYNSDGTLIASANGDGTAQLWNPSTGELMDTLEGDVPSSDNSNFNSYNVAFSEHRLLFASFNLLRVYS